MIIEKVGCPSRRKILLRDLNAGDMFELWEEIYIVDTAEIDEGYTSTTHLKTGECVAHANNTPVKRFREDFVIKYSDADLEEWV